MSNVVHVETIADPNTSLSYLLNKINEALNVHAPLKTKRIKSDRLPSWFTTEIRQEFKIKNTRNSEIV